MASTIKRGTQSLCIVLLLLTCGALSAQNQRLAFGTLFWFMVPGQMVLAGRAFTTFLSRMASTLASFKSRRRPFKKTSPLRTASLIYKMDRAFLSLIVMVAP